MASPFRGRGYNRDMLIDAESCYRALTARDARFDGLFFVGVKSTGIYCRPVCTAKTPGRRQCRFFPVAALAESAGFRPCLRCRPELAPGHAPIDNARTIARAAATRIEAGALDHEGNLELLAEALGLSSRQLSRLFKQELGVTPIELAQTNRLLLAKRLIADTQLPLTRIAFAAGFASVRRFNDLFRKHYRLTPSNLRRKTSTTTATDSIRLSLAYRPPLAWPAMLRFLEARAIPGVEQVVDQTYRRTVRVGSLHGWLSVSPVTTGAALHVDLATELAPVLPAILIRLRQLFDLDARPDVIDGHLALDRKLAPLVRKNPGLRVPGAFEGFELCLRALLGQQISVSAASTLAGRVAARLGEQVTTPWPELNRMSPTAESIAASTSAPIAKLGMPQARAECLRTLAQTIARGELDLSANIHPTTMIARLQELPGIGPWTAEYIAMRALRWPDAFPAQDLGLLKATGLKTAAALHTAAEPWRPWRSYAALHLWKKLEALKK
jgi:AraC family transcriptional regulator of adaptative response / DNA-3-methyladenine glycosylase II